MIGTHGTCGANAEKIQSEGFIPKGGWRGTGVYFWEGSLDTIGYFEELGYLWWCHVESKGKWPKVGGEFALFTVEIDSSVNTINFHDSSQSKAFTKFVQDLHGSVIPDLTDDERCRIFDLYVLFVEEQKKVDVRIVRAIEKTPHSKQSKKSICSLQDAHRCVIVRDVACIGVTERKS